MSKIKSSILLFSKFVIFFIILSSFYACSISLFNKNYSKYKFNIYIDDIPNLNGILTKNHLKEFFPLTEKSSSNYIVKTEIKYIVSLSVIDSTGYSTKRTIQLVTKNTLIDAKTNKVLTTISGSYTSSFSTGETSQITTERYKNQQLILSKQFAKDFSQKIILFLTEYNKKQESEQNKENPINSNNSIL